MGALVYYTVIFPLSFLPLWVLYGISNLFYGLTQTFFPYRKKVIDSNLSRSFPNLSETERKVIRKKFYSHFSDLLSEGIKNLSISERELRKRFKVVNPKLMEELYGKNKSVILVSGHYNNWEWLITSQAFLFPHRAIGIGMPLTSKFWDKKINERRQRFGMKVVHAGNFKEIITQQTEPIAILTLGDQSPVDAFKSYWMDFLNQKTAVLFGTEQMAHQYDYAVVFFLVRKLKRGYYEMELKLLTDSPQEMQWGEITEKHTQLLEQEIRNKPEFWIWSHKRWKRDVPANLEELCSKQKQKFNDRFKTN